MKEALAIIGALVAMFSTVPYMIDIIRRKTQPNIVTWITWTSLTGIATAASFAAHEPRSALLTLGCTIGCFCVVLLGLHHGIAKLSRFDLLCQAGAVVGLLSWLLFKTPLIGIAVPVLIDCIGTLPTIRHSWENPAEETWQTFFVNTVASSLTILSLSAFTLAGLLYPVYLALADALLVIIIIWRRRQLVVAGVSKNGL